MLGCNTTCVICERWTEQTFLLLWFVVHVWDVARFSGLVFTASIYVWVCWPCFSSSFTLSVNQHAFFQTLASEFVSFALA
jgi:hypothetical protein